jgi:hypothetical protein
LSVSVLVVLTGFLPVRVNEPLPVIVSFLLARSRRLPARVSVIFGFAVRAVVILTVLLASSTALARRRLGREYH